MMFVDTKRYYAVITGDFIGFSDLPAHTRQQMPDVLVQTGRGLCGAFGPWVYGDVSVFRGDSWQTLVVAPVYAFRAALFFRAAIRSAVAGVDTRMAIGIGRIDYVPEKRVSAGDGPAFRRSGKMLEQMTGSRAGRLRLAFPDIEAEGEIDAIVRLAGTLGDRWSRRQAKAVLGALKGFSPTRIAADWPPPISRQAVGKHLSRAGWPALAHALCVVEKRLEKNLSGRQIET
ncbi:MAG: hypothetical protein ACQERN_09335 [Thermodesulfobacteriota bacterium]